MTDKPPFFSISREMLVGFRVVRGERPQRSDYPKAVFTDHMWVLLVNCWTQDPAQRPDMGTVVERLEAMMY